MSPTNRKILYAVSFEAFGIVVAGLGLLVMSNASATDSFALSALSAAVAMAWSFVFNTGFEAWEARQVKRGRSFLRRAVHAALFEAGLVVTLVPVLAWWLQIGLPEALRYEAGLIVLFVAYSYAFTWVFDRVFGLPKSAA